MYSSACCCSSQNRTECVLFWILNGLERPFRPLHTKQHAKRYRFAFNACGWPELISVNCIALRMQLKSSHSKYFVDRIKRPAHKIDVQRYAHPSHANYYRSILWWSKTYEMNQNDNKTYELIELNIDSCKIFAAIFWINAPYMFACWGCCSCAYIRAHQIQIHWSKIQWWTRAKNKQ